MKAEHQPTHFPPHVIAAISSRENGSMRYPPSDPEAATAMSRWLPAVGIDPKNTVGLLIKYGENRTYDTITEIDEVPGHGALEEDGWVEADALVTKKPNLALLLPTADCNATTIYDPEHDVIALVHLGWHSTVNNLAEKIVAYLADTHGTDPASLIVNFSPSIRRGSYIFDFLEQTGAIDYGGKPRWHSPAYATPRVDGKFDIDLISYNLDLLHESGVQAKNIGVANADTLKDKDYFSHQARRHETEQHRALGRFANVVMIGKR